MSAIDIVEKIGIPLIAAFIGAVLAFANQNRFQKRQDKKYVLATLMAYRHAGVAEVDFIKALNMIDIIFHDSAKVKEKVRKYFNYTSLEMYSGGQRVEAFFELVLEMAKDIGYKSLTLSEIKDFYVPGIIPPPKQEAKGSD
jgi:hypothetical protein